NMFFRCTLVATCLGVGAEPCRAQTPDFGCGFSIPCRLPSARMAHALAKEINFAGIDNPRTTLQDALEALAETYDVSFDLMEGAFSSEGLKDVLKYEIAATPIPSTSRVPLGSVLNVILARLPVGSGASYYVERDLILITTRAHASLNAWTEFKRESKSLLVTL